MPAPDQGLVERQYYLSVLGWASDVPSLSLEDLRQRVLEAKTIKALDRNIRYEDPTQPLPSTLQAAGLGSTTATDNGDGGITLATVPSAVKVSKYTYAEATYFKIVNAVQLAINPPQPPGVTASAGVTQRAAREDHIHTLPPKKPAVINYPPGRAMAVSSISGNMTFATLNRLNLVPVYIQVFGGGPLTCSQIGVNVAVAQASSFIRFGMWGVDAYGGVDFSKILFDSGQISSATTGVKNFAYTTPIPEGLYYCGVACQGATGAQINSISADIVISNNFSSTGGSNTIAYKGGVSGALPTSGGFDDTNGDGAPALLFTRS